MAQKLSNVEIVRQFETAVRVPQGVSRFITIVGSMPDISIGGGEEFAETYTCLLGPVLREHEFLGASCLPSIAFLVTTIEVSQCSIESWEADWDEDSGRVELRVQIAAAGAAAKASILFSVTILTAS